MPLMMRAATDLEARRALPPATTPWPDFGYANDPGVMDAAPGDGVALERLLHGSGGDMGAFRQETRGFTAFPGASFTRPGAEAAAVSTDPLKAIDWGTKLAATTIDVYFAPAGTALDGGVSLGWLPLEKKQAMLALRQIEAIANLTFRETASAVGAEFRLATTDFADPYDISFMVPPGEPHAGLLAFDVDYLEMRDPYSGTSLLAQGGVMFSALLHEFGHGVGLAHPHDDGGTSTILSGVTAPFDSYGVADLNQGLYTTMGYNHGWPAGPQASAYLEWRSFGYEATMTALDIAVIQRKYGANMRQATGNDTYLLPDGNQTGTGFRAIWDAGGSDTLRYDGSRAATIDLRPATLAGAPGGGGYVSWASGIRGGFTIAAGVAIENASGGSGNDQITGNVLGNRLSGGLGNDILNGYLGADLMIGGLGNDRYNVDDPADVVVEAANAGLDHVDSTISHRLADNVENLVLRGGAAINGVGNALANTLVGNSAANTLNGGLGADRMIGGAGADTFLFLGADEAGLGATRDVIADMESGVDLIDLSAIDARLDPGDQAFDFIGEALFSGLGGELRYANGIVQGSMDGDTIADFEIAIANFADLTAMDFLL